MIKLSIVNCRKVAEDRGGKCLSDEYINSKTKMLWQCSAGHQWYNSFGHVKNRNQWCPYCKRCAKLTIEDAHRAAAKKGGKCISSVYIDAHSILEWECAMKHTWKASLASIKNRDSWCPFCSGNAKLSINDCIAAAAKKGGKCLSKVYTNIDTKVEWQCKVGHVFRANMNNVLYGNTWCPICANALIAEKLRLANGLGVAKQIAEKRNGTCLSVAYRSVDTKMLWECKCGHRWQATLYKIKSGRWCPMCSVGKSQKELFDILCQIFEDKRVHNNFRNFDWLKTPDGGKQEIDIWVPDVQLAIEYDGAQHFVPVRFGGITEAQARKNLTNIKRLDRLKNKKIKQHGDEIKYFVRFNYREKITEEYVRHKLCKSGVKI